MMKMFLIITDFFLKRDVRNLIEKKDTECLISLSLFNKTKKSDIFMDVQRGHKIGLCVL